MNIIWITKLSDSNPFKSTQFGITSALRKKGHKVQLFLVKPLQSNTPSTPTHTYLSLIDIPFISGLIFGLYLLIVFPIVIKRNHVDVVIIDGDQILSPFCVILRMMKPLIIWDIRSLPIDRSSSFLHDLSFYHSKLFVDALTTITPELKMILTKKYHLHTKPIGIWTSGVSPEIFNDEQNPTFPLSDKDPKDFIVMYHGTYSPTRGIEELITSISYISSDIKDHIKLRIIGINQNDRPNLDSIVHTLSLHEHVEILPSVDQTLIPSYIKQSDVGIIPLPPLHPWWQVSIPLKTLEYLMMKTPVIVTNIPFHQQLLSNCLCGKNVTSADPKDLAFAISWMYEHKNQLQKMGANGKHYVETQFSFDKVSTDLETFIKSIMVEQSHEHIN